MTTMARGIDLGDKTSHVFRIDNVGVPILRACVEGEAGLATEVVLGLDPARFGFGFGFGSAPGTDAALQAIDGHTVTLEADLVDDNSAELSIARAVVLHAAPDSIENP
jgi:hypothetical protein